VFLSSSTFDLAAAPRPESPPATPPPLDFSGVWDLDEKMSENVSAHMKGAVLEVTQQGNRIWISPVQPGGGSRQQILSEEIVVDSRPYEKALGPGGKGVVTAGWAKDRESLWIEVLAGPPGNPGEAVQRSVWKLSEDRSMWIRQSVSIAKGKARNALLVFRRRKR